jgi:hypothetical protein
MPLRLFTRTMLLAALLTLASVPAHAQSGMGGLRGFVTERISAANGIAGARVELRELYTWDGSKRKPETYVVETDATGNYSIPRVHMGEYGLRITANGFEPYETTFLITSDMSAVFGTLLKKSPSRRTKASGSARRSGRRSAWH